MNKLTSIFSTCLLASVVCADPVTVPNTFSAGTSAKASEVNANFTALANAVNNSPKPLMVYDSMGKVVGQYDANGKGVIFNFGDYGLIYSGVVKTGFTDWAKENIFYTSTDCTGNSYMLTTDYGGSPTKENYLINQLVVFGNLGEGSVSKGLILDKTTQYTLTIGSVATTTLPGCLRLTNPYPETLYKTNEINLSIFVPPFSVH